MFGNEDASVGVAVAGTRGLIVRPGHCAGSEV